MNTRTNTITKKLPYKGSPNKLPELKKVKARLAKIEAESRESFSESYLKSIVKNNKIATRIEYFALSRTKTDWSKKKLTNANIGSKYLTSPEVFFEISLPKR